MKRVIAIAALAVASTLSYPALATTHAATQAHADHHALSEGEVRRVDKDAKKLTIRHGAIANLDMPPMTMVFQVQDASVLDQFKVGDKIRFRAEKLGGAYTVTAVESAK